MMNGFLRDAIGRAVGSVTGEGGTTAVSFDLSHEEEAIFVADFSAADLSVLRDAARRRSFVADLSRALGALPGGPVEVVSAGPLPRLRLKPTDDALLSLLSREPENPAFAPTGDPVSVEFVSANPNDALSVVHARAAVAGETLCRILGELGVAVRREYYHNDVVGNALARFLKDVARPDAANPFARSIASLVESDSSHGAAPTDQAVLDAICARHLQTLGALGVRFDRITSEAALVESGVIARLLDDLEARELAYRKSGALWLRTVSFGDDQDRVLQRADGTTTYFGGDLAYHVEKMKRDASAMIDLWDTDHAGYVRRTQAALAAVGLGGKLDVALVGPVRVVDDGVERRVGKFGGAVTIDEAVAAIGADSLRAQLLRFPLAEPATLRLDRERAAIETRAAPLSPAGAATALLRFEDTLADAATARDPSILSRYAEEIERRIEADFGNDTALSAAVSRRSEQVRGRCRAILGSPTSQA